MDINSRETRRATLPFPCNVASMDTFKVSAPGRANMEKGLHPKMQPLPSFSSVLYGESRD